MVSSDVERVLIGIFFLLVIEFFLLIIMENCRWGENVFNMYLLILLKLYSVILLVELIFVCNLVIKLFKCLNLWWCLNS